MTKREHPVALRPYLPEIEAFGRHNHLNVLHPLLRFVPHLLPALFPAEQTFRLLALGLGLEENRLVDLHGYSAVGESYGAFFQIVWRRSSNPSIVRFLK